MKELKPSGLFSIPIGVGDTYKKYGSRIELWSMDGFEVITVGFQFKIIGCCTEEHIDFDCKALLGMTPEEIRSLLTANDVHFVNPYELKGAGHYENVEEYFSQQEKWQEAESKLVEKILILKPL